jgi:acetyl esterase/lipase
MNARGFLALAVSLVVSASVAQAQTRYVDVMFDGPPIKTENVVYGMAKNSQGNDEELTLDVYTPDEDEPPADRGLYIWVHGGNFRVGNKGQTGPLLDYVSRGWVGISINYRKRPELPGNAAVGAVTDPASLPAFIDETVDARHDAQAAVRWARANAAGLGIDENKIAIGGISAGAIISLMVAYNHEDPGNSGFEEDVPKSVSSAVAAAISHAGAYAPVLLGDIPRPGDPPIAIYHGVLDEQVPYPLAPLTCILQLAVLNDCEFVTFPAEDHATLGTDLARDFLYRHVIVGRAETRFPFLADLTGEPIRVLAGVEPAGVDLGVTAGAVVPKDSTPYVDHTVALVGYVLGALGVPLPD